jgi:hypothetical protein
VLLVSWRILVEHPSKETFYLQHAESGAKFLVMSAFVSERYIVSGVRADNSGRQENDLSASAAPIPECVKAACQKQLPKVPHR